MLGAACSRAPLAPNTGASSAGGNGAYERINLGTLGGGWAVPAAINDAGVIIGSSQNADRVARGFIYENGLMGELSGTSYPNRADAINGAGQIAGFEDDFGGGVLLWEHAHATARRVETGNSPIPDRILGINDRGEALISLNEGSHTSRAKLWRGGALQDLGGLSGPAYWTTATAWNARGQVVGSSRVRTVAPTHEIFHPFIWENGAIRDLGLLGAYPCGDAREDCASGSANDINAGGVVVGTSENAAGVNRAVIWENGVLRELAIFPGLPTEAFWINDRGQVLGRIGFPEPGLFLWERGSVRRLQTLGGGHMWARSFSERGEVVGSAEVPGGAMHAFVWQDGVMTDLGPGEATGINAQGDIIGTDGARGMLWRQSRRLRSMVIQPPPPQAQ